MRLLATSAQSVSLGASSRGIETESRASNRRSCCCTCTLSAASPRSGLRLCHCDLRGTAGDPSGPRAASGGAGREPQPAGQRAPGGLMAAVRVNRRPDHGPVPGRRRLRSPLRGLPLELTRLDHVEERGRRDSGNRPALAPPPDASRRHPARAVPARDPDEPGRGGPAAGTYRSRASTSSSVGARRHRPVGPWARSVVGHHAHVLDEPPGQLGPLARAAGGTGSRSPQIFGPVTERRS